MRNNYKRKRGCLSFIIIIGIFCFLSTIGYVFLVHKGILKKDLNINSKTTDIKKITTIPYQKLAEQKEELKDRYYYQQMNEDMQQVYQEILQGIKEDIQQIYLHSKDSEEVLKIYNLLLNDFPEFFWCTGEAEATYSSETEEAEAYVMLQPTYIYMGKDRKARQQAIDSAVEVCLSGVSQDSSEYEKIKYVYDYIVQTTNYNENAPDNQNVYSALVNRESVCAGYARANQLLLRKLGVFSIYLTGTATSSDNVTQPHAWNIVQCDGVYYQVDVTWGDPVFSQEDDPGKMEMNYDYFCCTDSEIMKSHVIDSDLIVPACISSSYNYYLLNGMYYDIFNETIALNAMKTSIDAQNSSTTFKYSNAQEYQVAVGVLQDHLISEAAQYLINSYGLGTVNYYYQLNEAVNRITIFWQYG